MALIARKRWILVLMLLLGVVALAYYYVVNPPARKPLEPEPVPRDYGETILGVAHNYADALNKKDFQAAKDMSSPENIELIDSVVKPKLSYWERKIGQPGSTFRSLEFEDALLVNDNMNDMIVVESLNFPRVIEGVTGLYIQFRIKKVGNRYLVERTNIVEIKATEERDW